MSRWTEKDAEMMRLAIEEAEKALARGEVPVGAVLEKDGKVICRAGNTREAAHDPSGHAEINALRGGAAALGGWRLDGCTLYVTLEPCCMCAGTIAQTRLKRVVFGAYDEQAGCCGSVYRLTEDRALRAYVPADGGLMREACEQLMTRFEFGKRGRTGGEADSE